MGHLLTKNTHIHTQTTGYNPIDITVFGELLQLLSHTHTWILFHCQKCARVTCSSFECVYLSQS